MEFVFDSILSRKNKFINIIMDSLVSYLIFLGSMMVVRDIFAIKMYPLFIYLPAALVIVVMNIFLWNGKSIINYIVPLVGIIAVVALMFTLVVRQGLMLTINRVIAVISSHTNEYISMFQTSVAENDVAFYCTCFIGVFSFVMAYLIVTMVKLKAVWASVIIIIPIIIANVICETSGGFAGGVILLMGVLLLFSYSFVGNSNGSTRVGAGIKSIFISSGSSLLILLLITGLIIGAMFFNQKMFNTSLLSTVKEAADDMIYDIRYETGNKTNTLTQGNFRRLGNLEFTDDSALEVSMTRAQSMYLRGFVGSKYSSSGWESLDAQDNYDSYPLYYWLHKDGFNSLNQLSLANRTVGELADNNVISVKNISANSKYLYTPYELISDPSSIANANSSGDISLVSREMMGTREYSFIADQNLIVQYPNIINSLYEMDEKNDEKAKQYLEDESNYNEDVYKKYTELPANIRTLLQTHLGDIEANDGSHMHYETAITTIQNYLKNNIVYSTLIDSDTSGGDFLTNLLDSTQKGYSVHYATAATMMFRYFGIPARYVEGYLITPEDVEGLSGEATIMVPGSNAHAWVEIYFDTVGWVPVEVTPPYMGLMDTPDILSGVKFAGSNNPTPDEDKDTAVDDEDVIKNNLDDSVKQKALDFVKIALIVIASLIVLFIIFRVVRRLVKRKKVINSRLALTGSADNNVAAWASLQYLIQILEYDGYSRKAGEPLRRLSEQLRSRHEDKYADKYIEVVTVGEKALFSQNTVSDEDKTMVEKYTGLMLKHAIKSRNIFKRIKMKYIDCMY